MEITEQNFLAKVELGKDKWNQWISEIKAEMPNEYLLVEITTNKTLIDLFRNDQFDGFSGFDFSNFGLWILNCDFPKLSTSIKPLLTNLKGFHQLVIKGCKGTIPNISLENLDNVFQISITGFLMNDGSYSLKSEGITLSNCQFSAAGLHLQDITIDGFFQLTDCQFKHKNSLPQFSAVNVNFNYLVFMDRTFFQSITTVKKCVFHGTCQIRQVTFSQYVEFINCEFLDRTDFEKTTFVVPPRFNGSLLNSQTQFPTESYFNVLKTKDKTFINVHIAAFQLLKSESSKLLDRRTQGMFFSLEQKYLRQSNRMSCFDKMLSLGYQMSSNYGRSILRPILLLMFTFILFTVIYSCIQSSTISPSLSIDWDIVIKSSRYSLANIFLPFKLILQDQLNDQIGIVLLSIVQSLISLSFIALTLLSMRWNFRRD